MHKSPSKINLDQLRIEIKMLHRSHVLYRVLKQELSKIGHWKNRPRGDPFRGRGARGKASQKEKDD